MFSDNTFNGIISPNWDTTKITDMSYMFYKVKKFNQKIGDNWDFYGNYIFYRTKIIDKK